MARARLQAPRMIYSGRIVHPAAHDDEGTPDFTRLGIGDADPATSDTLA